jgi:transcriptional regulator with XRE-family HTH domain
MSPPQARSRCTSSLVAPARDASRGSCHHARVAKAGELGHEATTLGERVRVLRRSVGLSQAELAAGRFSKEYVSQIELGKTQPTAETLEWLAGRLHTDREFLEHGVSKADAARIDDSLSEAERLTEVARYGDALRALSAARDRAGGSPAPAVRLRLLRAEAWVRIRTGELEPAMTLLEEAAAVAVSPGLTDFDRAAVVFQVGVVRYSESKIADAIVLFGEALKLAGLDGAAADRLRSDIFHWRSRCHRRNRDWVAAEEDIEHALELAEQVADRRRIADALFQASLVAQRQGRYVLARTQAERARVLFAELGDRATVARLLNNLAGLGHLLGDDERAVALLEEAFALFVELDLAVEAGYVCSSLAGIQVESGDLDAAERNARKALDLLGGRVDHLQEIGMAELTLGRARAGQGALDEAETWIAKADETFGRARSTGHRSFAWLAQGDVESLRGSDAAAAGLYRQAAVALQDDA